MPVRLGACDDCVNRFGQLFLDYDSSILSIIEKDVL